MTANLIKIDHYLDKILIYLDKDETLQGQLLHKRPMQTPASPDAASYAANVLALAVYLVMFPSICLLLAGTSLENNNVFTVQPTVYFEGMDPATESASMYQDVDLMPAGQLNPATVTVGIVALGIVAVAGSATAIYYEVRMAQ
jgi:streptogramin lyase